MLPLNRVTLSSEPTQFRAPDGGDSKLLVSEEMGGIELNDGSQGRAVQVWTARIEGQDVLISAPTHPESLLFSVAGDLTAVSLAFDPNMQPVVCYREDGLFRVRHYDSTSSDFVLLDLPGATSAKASTDDTRDGNGDLSDVIIGFVRGDVLYWLQQRDRFAVEYVAGPANGMQLSRMGMTYGWRFGFELRIGG